MKISIKSILVICIGFWGCIISSSAFSLTADDLKRGSSEAEQQLQDELTQLQKVAPDLFTDRQVSSFANFGPSFKDADLLLLATEICDYDLDTLYQKFPVLSYIYNPIFLGDLDQDGEKEILCVPDLEPSNTYLFIFKQGEDKIEAYQRVFDIYRMKISVHELSNHEKQIIGRSEGERRVQIKGTNELVTVEWVREMILRFTGSDIEIVRPLMVVDEQVVLDD